ncbi:hypothetical protein ACH40E_33355 [Streptomyces acidicola]|uniref:hypothetical protein n=1 Tax=Streptomyces acidicola TaxID=2596892 RepID=UPI0037B823D8
MTDRPYTDDDLRAEAARQHKNATEDPDFSGIGEQMEGHKIPSRGDFQWDQLGDHDFETAQRAIDDLLTSAADVSEWAINLGVDGLEPTGHTIQLGEDSGDGDRPRVRLHFAFHPDMPDADRDYFAMALSKVVLRNL